MACFDLGSYAALDLFVDEMISLWEEGFDINGKHYRVFVKESLMDSRGREKFLKVQGSGAFAGCNRCKSPSRTFAKARINDSFRRYLPARDRRRKKSTQGTALLQYGYEEREGVPPNISYDEYIANGLEAEEEGHVVDGVHGVWCFGRHPLGHLNFVGVDGMHCLANVVEDMYGTLRPTIKTTDHVLSENTNRTYKTQTIISCEEELIHKNLYVADDDDCIPIPPWVLLKAECKKADGRMNTIIGPPGVRRIQKVMKRGKGNKSTHDSLEWASVFARWCLHGLGTEVYVNNILDIFDVLSVLSASTLRPDAVSERVRLWCV
jgi:hypothetical protein